MELRDVNVLLGEHRRWWWWRWRFCRCGLTHPCRLRKLALAEAFRMWAELADKARRQQERLADGDTINVGRYRRYADLVRPEVSDEPAVGRAPVRAGWPRWTAARR